MGSDSPRKPYKPYRKPLQNHHILYLLIFAIVLWLFIVQSSPVRPHSGDLSTGAFCAGRYVYIHKLPAKFNEDILRDCASINPWLNMCKYVENAGLGQRLKNPEGVLTDDGSWYGTKQFVLDVILHNRMKQYECLTEDSSKASAVYVPFYGGLDIERYLWGYNISVRDANALDLVRWLRSQPEWKAMGGRDHFMAAGRITWDFRRKTEGENDWGSKLLFLPEVKNMTVFDNEASPWHANDFAIPYPTYFHPSEDRQVFEWQDRIRGLARPWLFSFAGAPRPNMSESIRNHLIHQCKQSTQCRLLECGGGRSKCHSPSSVMQVFQSSIFCLQPSGDSYTRRSTFDAMLAGCIPVFFHPGTAYTQYIWHMPSRTNFKKYSVFISEDDVRDGKVRIEDVLSKYGEEEIRAMRDEVIKNIPRFLYADPRGKLEIVKDAVDIVVERVIERIGKIRRNMREGKEEPKFLESNSWKYKLFGNEDKHEWDAFFHRSW